MSFEKIHKGNARAFFNLYMARKDQVLHEFKLRSQLKSGPGSEQLNYSAQSLVFLWAWVRDQMPYAQQHPSSEQAPPWYDFGVRNNSYCQGIHFTPEAAANIDGLAYYWGETLIKNIPDLKWDIGAYPKSFGFACPVVQGDFFGAYPLHTAISFAILSNKSEFRDKPNLILEVLEREADSAAKYKENYLKTGKHDDPRPPRRVKFE